MAKQYKANPNNLISFKQFNLLTILVNKKEYPDTADLPFGENGKMVTVPLLKICTPGKVVENGSERNDWMFHPSKKTFNALMAAQLIDYMFKQPEKGSNNGPVEDGGTAPIVNGWDNF